MATKRNDDKGYERGARGINGRDGEHFVKWGPISNAGKVSGSDGGPGSASQAQLQKNAVGGTRKIGG